MDRDQVLPRSPTKKHLLHSNRSKSNTVALVSSSTAETITTSSSKMASKEPEVSPYVDCAKYEKSEIENLLTEEDLPVAIAASTNFKCYPNRRDTLRRRASLMKIRDTFPTKLHHMLSMVDIMGLNHIVSWKPHGRAFEVKDVDQFVTFILPSFFKQSKITSFQRQLNLYGFQRFAYGPDAGSSYHQYFLRGKTCLCKALIRTKVKGVKKRCSRKTSDRLGKEPDFYKMEFLPQFDSSCSNGPIEGCTANDKKLKQMDPYTLWCSDKLMSKPAGDGYSEIFWLKTGMRESKPGFPTAVNTSAEINRTTVVKQCAHSYDVDRTTSGQSIQPSPTYIAQSQYFPSSSVS